MAPAAGTDARTRPIPKSIVARALEGVRYAITGVAPENWFGPMQPGTRPRAKAFASSIAAAKAFRLQAASGVKDARDRY